MARIQEPPRDFDQLSLAAVDVEPDTVVRMAWTDPTSQLSFSRRARLRFDAPAGEYGTLYAGFDFKTAFAETVLRDHPRQQPAGATVILDHRELGQRRVLQLGPGPFFRPLRLIKLYENRLAAANTDNQNRRARSLPTTHRWSLAIRDCDA